jgi:hypothetical protein
MKGSMMPCISYLATILSIDRGSHLVVLLLLLLLRLVLLLLVHSAELCFDSRKM